MEFEEYLDRELSKPIPPCYGNNPITSIKSNSARSVVNRMRIGVLTSLKWEFKLYFHNYYETYTDWDGIDTPLSWFIFILLSPITFLTLPFITFLIRYKSAISLYRDEYIKITEDDDI